MSETRETLAEREAAAELKGGSNVDHEIQLPLNAQYKEPAGQDLQGRAFSPSLASPERTGLLSLPWEMVARIVSHLPAECVITVLPQVCRALRDVSEDSAAWQLRARRLIGSQASFPLGPVDGFDWPAACLEMEQLIGGWARPGGAAVEADWDRGVRVESSGGGGSGAHGGAHQEGDGGLGNDGERRSGHGAGGAVEDREEEVVAEEVEQVAGEMERERMERAMVGLSEGHGQGGGDDVTAGHGARPGGPPSLEHFCLPSAHIAEVNCLLLVGPEGALCASGSRDRNVILWDLRERQLLHTLRAPGLFSSHRGWVWCLAGCGPLLCSGSFDSTVRLWDLEAGGAECGLIRGHAAVLCLSCQADVLLAGSVDKKVSIYDTRAAEPLVKSLHLHGSAVLCLAADDKYILSASKDGSLAVFDWQAGKLLQKMKLKSYIRSMSYGGQEVWAGDNRGILHTFSLQNGSLRAVSQFDVGHRSLVTGVHRSPGALYTCSSDRTIKVHLPSAPPRTLCTLHRQSAVNGLSVEAGVLAVASGNICVEVWKPAHQ
ncbi:F-box/WD repeat-containing protein 9 [Brienomyrus brachyistius]|uniref:F-box/WD repeat-containing protein 9 n=1 Tax=Brienomyrus brachyistius TaxID=42636 RepID=UPI0020B45E08|nr:F-box/WD repeat-containing protein 9 [Brienomyrus brachyistius]